MKRTIKPRNPLVAPARFRKAGEHRKTFKAKRRDEAVKLLKAVKATGKTGKTGRNPDFARTFLVQRDVRTESGFIGQACVT